MDTREQRLQTITKMLEELISEHGIDPDETLLDSGKLASLTSMNLLIAIEDHFHIKVPNSQLNRKNFRSLRTISNMVEALLVEQADKKPTS